MLLPNALTTLAKVKLALAITGTSQDADIERTINGITSMIEGICNRRFLSQVYTNEEYDVANNDNKLFLKNYPVTVVTSVEYRTGVWSSPVWVAYTTDQFLPYFKEGYIKFAGRFSNASLAIRSTYTAGYLIDFANESNPALHTLPQDLTQVCTELVAQSVSTPQGVQSESTEGQSISYDTQGGSKTTEGQSAVLNKYKSFVV